MCTLSIFRHHTGYHIYMNRDERHDRTDGKPPQTLMHKYDVTGPLDPVSAGTWIAFNKNGYWGCMLNGYYEDASKINVPKKTRGKILLNLLNTENPLKAAEDFNPNDYLSFRLVIGSLTEHKLFIWTGEKYGQSDFLSQYKDQAFFLSSSSLDQDDIIQIRKKKFDAWAKNTDEKAYAKIPDFHFSKTPAPEQAPMMMRSYSGTKSVTAMHISKGEKIMEYTQVNNYDKIKSAA